MQEAISKLNLRPDEVKSLTISHLADLLKVKLDEALIIKRAAEKVAEKVNVSSSTWEQGVAQTYDVPSITFGEGFPLPPHLQLVMDGKTTKIRQKVIIEFVDWAVYALTAGYKVSFI